MNGKGEKTMGDTKKENDNIMEFGQAMLHADRRNTTIYLLSIIGEIEGHECLPSTSKTTKYEHVLPRLAAIEDDESVNGVLLLLNTMGGDVESGLAIAEMVASLSKPTVSLVLGGSHSIGVPLAVSTDYSFIVPSGTMVIHPVRMSGTVIGAKQTYDYFKQKQHRKNICHKSEHTKKKAADGFANGSSESQITDKKQQRSCNNNPQRYFHAKCLCFLHFRHTLFFCLCFSFI